MQSSKPAIAILTDSSDYFLSRRYLLNLFFPRWEAEGFRVIVRTERDPFEPADIAILHSDVSVVPHALQQIATRYERTVNGAVLDIRKRVAVGHEVTAEYGGGVIVKTDANYRGLPELRRAIAHSAVGGLLHDSGRLDRATSLLARLEALRSWRKRRVVDSYDVHESAGAVPAGVWKNRHLVVEPFRPERSGGKFCCRHWLFFGSREVSRRTIGTDPMVKLGSSMEELHEPVPQALREIRRRLRFDYGKFDYGLIDGEVVLYDVNRTPGASADPSRHAGTIAALAGGIGEFLNA